MNLPSLQYIDINNAITSVISVGSYPGYSTLLRKTQCPRRPRHIVVERTRRQHGATGGSKARNNNAQNAPPLLEAWPMFPNSLLSTEIVVDLPGQSRPALAKDPSGLDRQAHDVLDFPADTSLHYRLQEPLPSYLGGLMYRAGRHAIAILDDESNLLQTDTSLMRELHLALNPQLYRVRSPHEVLIPHFFDSKSEPGGSLKSRRRDRVLIELYQLSNLCHRLNVIGKADLVLCDSAGIAVDALRSSVPVAFIAGTPPGFEKLQDCLGEFLQHANPYQLLDDQQKVLDDILEQSCSQYHVMSNQPTLHALVRDQLASIGDPGPQSTPVAATDKLSIPDQINSTSDTDDYDDLILRTQQSLCSRANKSVRLKSGLESSRRKFQKFKESPTRFMEDSQSAILRTIVAGRPTR